MYGESRAVPTSLHRLIDLLCSDEVQKSIHGTSQTLLAAVYAARRKDAQERKARGETEVDTVGLAIDAVLDKLVSPLSLSISPIYPLPPPFFACALLSPCPCHLGVSQVSDTLDPKSRLNPKLAHNSENFALYHSSPLKDMLWQTQLSSPPRPHSSPSTSPSPLRPRPLPRPPAPHPPPCKWPSRSWIVSQLPRGASFRSRLRAPLRLPSPPHSPRPSRGGFAAQNLHPLAKAMPAEGGCWTRCSSGLCIRPPETVRRR